MVLPSAAAVSVEDLRGELSLEELRAPEGMDATSERTDAFFVPAGAEAENEGTLSIQSEDATINWTHVTVQASYRTGDSALVGMETSNETSEERYGEASLASQLVGSEAEMLVVPAEGARMQLTVDAHGAEVSSSTEDVWRVGELSDEPGAAEEDIRVFEQHITQPGQPLVQAPDGVDATLSGNLTVYVWESNVTVASEDGEQTYRSGYWTENETRDPALGRTVASEEHYKLLRLRLTDAKLTWSQSAGEARWTADRLAAETDGPVSYTVEEGSLVADDHRFSLEDDMVSLRGEVSHELSAGADDGVLQSHVEAERAEVGALPSSGEAGGGPWSWLAGLIVGLVAGGVATSQVSRISGRPEGRSGEPSGSEPSMAQIRVQAEEALNEHRPVRARQAAQTLIEAEVDVFGAWSIVAASYLQEARPELVVEEVAHHLDAEDLEQAADPSVRALLAYLLAYAYIQVGEVEEAWPWVEIAAGVGWVREKLRRAPMFEALRETDRFARVVGDGSESDGDLGPAYH